MYENSYFNVVLRIYILNFNICLITERNAEEVSILWPKKPQRNEMDSLLVLLP